MKTIFQKRLAIILLAVLALGALTVLAISLNNVPFNEAQSYGRREAVESSPLPLDDVVEIWKGIPLWKHIVLWSLVGLMLVLLILLLSPELRKRFILMLIRTGLTVVAIIYLLHNYGDRLLLFQLGAQAPLEEGQLANTQPVPEFQPPQVSPMISYLISFGFALLCVAVTWALYRGWKKYFALNTHQPLDEIAHIARSSLKDLNSGRNSSDVIINCYLRMSDVVADKRQLQREIAVTPQEFALRLERAGLPGDAVRRLTGLFEAVRYGDRKSAPKDVNEAVSCLNIILHYCGEAG